MIQAFFIEDMSEEIKNRDRAARQRKKGSYNLIILESSLEKYLGLGYSQQIQEMRDKNSIYNELD